MEKTRGNRRTKQGVVISNKMAKTVVVRVERAMRHPKYNKVVANSKKYYAHDESGRLQPGDKVKLIEIRPLSKLKRWRALAKEE